MNNPPIRRTLRTAFQGTLRMALLWTLLGALSACQPSSMDRSGLFGDPDVPPFELDIDPFDPPSTEAESEPEAEENTEAEGIGEETPDAEFPTEEIDEEEGEIPSEEDPDAGEETPDADPEETDTFEWPEEADADSSGECRSEICCRDGDWLPAGAICFSGETHPNCVLERCSESHVCEAVAREGYCFIEGECVPDGTRHLQHLCLTCNAALHPMNWSPDSLLPCNDGNPCTLDDQCSIIDDFVGCLGYYSDCAASPALQCGGEPGVCCEFGHFGPDCSSEEAYYFGLYASFVNALDLHASGATAIVGPFTGRLDPGTGSPIQSTGESSSLLLTVFEPDHTPRFTRLIPPLEGEIMPSGVTFDPDGNIWVTGMFEGRVDFGEGPVASKGGLNLIVMKFGPTGDLIRARVFGAESSTFSSYFIASDSQGRIALTGVYNGPVEGIPDLTLPPVASGGQTFLLLLDSAGEVIRAQALGNPGGRGIVVRFDSESHILLSGFDRTGSGWISSDALCPTSNDKNVILAKFAFDGTPEWGECLYGDGFRFIPSLALDSHDRVWVVGYFDRELKVRGAVWSNRGRMTGFLGSYDPDGSLRFFRPLEVPEEGEILPLSIAVRDHVAFTGVFTGGADLGGSLLTSDGLNRTGSQGFIARFDLEGNPTSTWIVMPHQDNLLLTFPRVIVQDADGRDTAWGHLIGEYEGEGWSTSSDSPHWLRVTWSR